MDDEQLYSFLTDLDLSLSRDAQAHASGAFGQSFGQAFDGTSAFDDAALHDALDEALHRPATTALSPTDSSIDTPDD
eukprot:5196174-Pleurochrysis_carterae.AAC.1